MKPLIKWSGGKSDEINKFEKYIPKNFKVYLEPFIGGASVYFWLEPKCKSVISDVHVELIDFYNAIKDGNGKEIFDFMEENPNEEIVYYKIRNEMVIKCPLDNAKRFYYQRKTCYRGMMRYNKSGKFNIPFGRYPTCDYNILTNILFQEQLKNTEIICKDFTFVFENYNDENNFMFLDPPYDSEFTDYGYCKFGKNEHILLAEYFKTTKIKCLMVIGKTDFITELYKEYIVEEYPKKYRFKLHSRRIDNKINTNHLVIKNY